jgi:hypothetical protein
VFIAGNHDRLFEKCRDKARAMVPEGVIYLAVLWGIFSRD